MDSRSTPIAARHTDSQKLRTSTLDYLILLNQILRNGWTANVDRYGRIYYTSHATQTTQWVPPVENWDAGEWRLPYGWECANDSQGRIYFINHLDKYTTYDDPRLQGDDDSSEYEVFPTPREITLQRDPAIGFGFVAGSEKPVIVRFVNEDGPSAGKLLPSDLILKINGEDVEKAPRDHVIELVRACKDSVTLVVCQPQSDNASRKSAFLSAAKKARLKSKPSRVRFADGILINGTANVAPSASPEPGSSPFIPNVLKVFLENGQTKSFKYDGKTTVRDVMNSLKEKLSITAIEHFALVTEHVRSYKKNQLKLLSPDETIAKIAARPGAQHLRCLFRVMFIPKDAFDLLRADPMAFDYFYMQCCNDVIDERFATELRCDVALRLAALQMQQHSLNSNVTSKVSVKRIEKECGLERFIPPSILEAMKHKELRRLLSHLIKVNNQQLCAPGQKRLTETQIKVHYLKILSEMTTFGGRCFNVLFPDTKTDGLILISPKFGLSQISGTLTGAPVKLTELEAIREVVISEVSDAYHAIEIHVKPPLHERFCFETENGDDLDDMVQMLNGYSKLFLGVPLRVLFLDDSKDDSRSPCDPPPYYGRHVVFSMPWSYPADLKTINIQFSDQIVRGTSEQQVDFSKPPLPQEITALPEKQATIPEVPSITSATGLSTQRTAEVRQKEEKEEELPPTPTHIEVKLSRVTNGNLVQPDIAKSMRFIDDSTSSELDTPVAERALRLANIRESDVIRYHNHVEANVRETNITRYQGHVDAVFFGQTMITNNLPVQPDIIQHQALRSASNAELAAQLSRLNTPSTPVEQQKIWPEKIELASDSEETDSVSTTPTDSPIHRLTGNGRAGPTHRAANPPSSLFRSGSSFGLHSPDDFGKFKQDGMQVYVDSITEMDRLERKDSNRQSVGSLFHDPDIIDLCQIPIPEEASETMIYSDIEVPPTPFRDPLVPFPGSEHVEDYLPDIQEDAPLLSTHLLTGDSEKSSATLDEALNELNSFIAAMTIPDPDEYPHPHLHRVTSEDIRNLVIPPPPAHSPSRPPSAITSRHDSRSSPSTSGVESVIQKPPIPPKPKCIPPPPPPRNKSLERNGGRSLARDASEVSRMSDDGNGVLSSLVSPRFMQKNSNSGDLENTEAFRDCVAEINAQLNEIAQRKSNASSESDLVSTTPSASEESTPVMWRKNPVLNFKSSKKPPIIGGIHPSATLPFSATKPTGSQNRNRYRNRPPPPRDKFRKRLAVVRVQNPSQTSDHMANGNGDDEDESNFHRSAYGPSNVTRVDIQMGGHRKYEPETDAEVLDRVCGIIAEIDWTLDSIRRPDTITPNLTNLRLAREQLVSEARRFVTASKAFVKSSTVMLSGVCEPASLSGSGNEMASSQRSGGRPTSLTGSSPMRHSMFHESLVRCTDLIGMMFHSATLVARYSSTVEEAVNLIEGILMVSLAFRFTIEAAFRPSTTNTPVQENSLHDPAVKLLMSEATKLAASLTTLMRTIRSIESSQNGGSQFRTEILDERQLQS